MKFSDWCFILVVACTLFNAFTFGISFHERFVAKAPIVIDNAITCPGVNK